LVSIANDPRYRFVHGDIRDRHAVTAALTAFRPGAIIHLAAETHVDRSIDGPLHFLETNVQGTVTLLQAVTTYWMSLPVELRETFRFVHVSTDEVFGSLSPSAPPFNPRSGYEPSSPYSASKASADHFVRAWHTTYGLPTIVTNCSNNFGPWQFPEKFIPVVILRAAVGDPVPIYGDGHQVRDWLSVYDHAAGLVAAVEKGKAGETYLFGARNEWPNRQLAEVICNVLDDLLPTIGHPRRELLTRVTDRPGHDSRYAIDPTLAESELGWSAATQFKPALRDTIAWYLGHREWLEDKLRKGGGYKRIGLGGLE
jgi:dTDP-glucose 4,6-dehydratase